MHAPEPENTTARLALPICRITLDEWLDQLLIKVSAYGPTREQFLNPAGERCMASALAELPPTTEIEITLSGMRRLVKNIEADMIRRPVLGALLLRTLEAFAPESDAQTQILHCVQNMIESFQYNHFRRGLAHHFQSSEARSEIFRGDTEFASRIIEALNKFSIDTEFDFVRPLTREYMADANGEKRPEESGWVNDTGHGFDMFSIAMRLRANLDDALGLDREPARLKKLLSFMLIDDDEAEETSGYHLHCGFLLFEPKTALMDNALCHSRARTAEEAIARFDARPPNRMKFPDLLLIDIELGTEMNGLDLATHIRREADDRGEKPLIMVHSAGIEKFRERLETLKAAGVINGFFNKRGFTGDTFIQAVNEAL